MIKSPQKYFFLNDDKLYHTRNKLAGNPRIIKFNPYDFIMKGMFLPTPSFETIEELTTSDKRFREFKKKKSWQLIAKEENIITIDDLIFQSNNDDSQAGNMILHILNGKWDAKKFTGIHYLPTPHPSYIINFKVITPPNDQGVYKASFDIQNGNGKILKKDEISTMFPDAWSRQELYDECLFALKNRIKTETRRLFNSFTRSGIRVEIYFNESETRIHTLYPVLQ